MFSANGVGTIEKPYATVKIINLYATLTASLVAQLVKNRPAIRELGFDPWVGKIPWRRERLSTPVFWPGEFHVLYSPWGHKESDMTEQLSLSLFRDLVIKSPVTTLKELIANNRQGMYANVLITVLNITYQMNECMLK